MGIPQAVGFSHYLLENHLKNGDFAIDATCGNGYDTEFLAELVGKDGKVLAIDIQADAINNTKELLKARGLFKQVEVKQGDHSNIDKLAEEFSREIKAIIYNLGYLPGGDKKIITEADNTLRSCEKAVKLLARQGLLVITMYPGHEGGRLERDRLLDWASKLDGKKYNVSYYSFINQPGNPPEVSGFIRGNN